jgi:bifunctional UDP-N-acetylglucosamine pyrophosphorylase / glucosamine-1-phosphate N-acetyltransferase
MSEAYAVVLAAGQGTRMKSKRHKVLHPVCGKPMVRHVLDSLQQAGIQRTLVVIGSLAEQVREELGEQVEFVYQSEQLGTGHAVMQAIPQLTGFEGTTLVCYGDTPLISAETIRAMLSTHQEKGAAATVLTAIVDQPFGYGRIIRDTDGSVMRIVEEKDATAEEKAVTEVNSGTYCFDNRALLQALSQLDNNNAQKEYYLTDCLSIIRSQGLRVEAYTVQDSDEILGVNDRAQLAHVDGILRRRIRLHHMKNGVSMVDPDSIYIDADVEIGADTVLYPGTYLQKGTRIGSGCEIGPNVQISQSTVGDYTEIKQAVLDSATIGSHVKMGPFAYIRPGTKIEDGVKVGDFVEIKNSVIGQGTKVPHLAYVGDADIGSHTNIGCGVITVNYDGVKKHRTVVGDHSFIGSNSNLIAPVTVGDHAYVAAGSTITDPVPDGALAIARERQVTKEGYQAKLEARLKERNLKK